MLRKNMPLPEIVLWQALKGRKLGYRFSRQISVDKYIIDFYCKDLQLAIEVDGDSHYFDGANEQDGLRQKRLEMHGIQFLRFTNKEVLYSLSSVVAKIQEWIQIKTHP